MIATTHILKFTYIPQRSMALISQIKRLVISILRYFLQVWSGRLWLLRFPNTGEIENSMAEIQLPPFNRSGHIAHAKRCISSTHCYHTYSRLCSYQTQCYRDRRHCLMHRGTRRTHIWFILIRNTPILDQLLRFITWVYLTSQENGKMELSRHNGKRMDGLSGCGLNKRVRDLILLHIGSVSPGLR